LRSTASSLSILNSTETTKDIYRRHPFFSVVPDTHFSGSENPVA
jgi:hypothetical protein